MRTMNDSNFLEGKEGAGRKRRRLVIGQKNVTDLFISAKLGGI